MALSDKTIVITPRTSVGSPLNADPNIRFTAAGGSPDVPLTINLFARPINSGTLSFEGSAGQLFSITNDLTGTIFSVNDISGVPSIEVNADGTVAIAEFGGNVGIGTGSPIRPLHVNGTVLINDTAPKLLMIETDATTDNAWWDHVIENEQYRFRIRGDADVGGADIYTVDRTGTAVDSFDFNPNVNFAAGIDVTGNITVTGTVDGVDVATLNTNALLKDGSVALTGTWAAGQIISTVPSFRTTAAAGNGIGFWNGAPTTYGHYMSDSATQGRIGGETTSDYNQYFEMNSGTNRGFVFETDATKLFAVNPDGVRSAVSMTGTTLTLNATTSSTLNISSTSTGNIAIALPGTSNIKKITDQGGTSFYCDSTMLLHAGDSGPALETDLGITSATTTENLYLTADNDITIIAGRQTNYATSYVFDFTAGGIFRVRNQGGPGTDYAEFSHDGTDFNIAATNTTDLNITGTNVTIDASSVLRFENAVTERIVMYGTENSATSYAMGVESSTLYYKANGNHRWYISVNADAGVSDTMNLSSTALHVGVPIYPNGQTVGNITSVGGNYGSINVTGADGSSGTYAGYSINDRVVFMNNGSTTSGIYDDTNNEWHILMTQNGAVNLYNNGVVTGATGIESFDVFANDSLSTSTCFYSWKLADGTRRGFIGYSGSDSIVWRSEIHGATVNINAEDSVGTLRTILAADPDSTTELRADTNLSLTVNAGTNALVATGGGAVTLYHAGTSVIQTQTYNGSDNITGAEIKHYDNTFYDIGLAVMPQVTATGAVTISDTHQHKTILITSGTGAISFVSDTTMRVNSVGWIINNSGSSNAITATTNVFWADGAGGQTGSRTLADGGWLTWWKQADTQYYITGVGIS